MPSNGRTNHPGTRRAHYRKGKPVKAAGIRRPKTQQRRRQVSRQVRSGRKPLLWGAGILAGIGALEAILAGRWGTAFVLFGVAGGLFVTHHAWQWHKNRQARKASSPRPSRKAAQQRREALEKARAAHQPQQDPKPAPAPKPTAEAPKPQPKPAATTNGAEPAPSANGKAPSKPPAPEPGPWQAPPTSNGGPTSHAESVEQNGHRCDCRECRDERRAKSAAFWSKKKPAATAKPKPWWPPQPREGTRAAYRFHALRASGYTGAIDKDGWAMTDIEVAREQARRRGEKPREGPK